MTVKIASLHSNSFKGSNAYTLCSKTRLQTIFFVAWKFTKVLLNSSLKGLAGYEHSQHFNSEGNNRKAQTRKHFFPQG